jgi:hypothetical protein
MAARPGKPDDVLCDEDDSDEYKPPQPKSRNARRDKEGNIKWPEAREVKTRTFYGTSRSLHTYGRKGKSRLHAPPLSQRRGNTGPQVSFAEQGSLNQSQVKSIYDFPSEYEDEEEDEETIKPERKERSAKTKAKAKMDVKGKGKAKENDFIALSSDDDATVVPTTRITRSKAKLRQPPPEPKIIPDPIPCPFCWCKFIRKESFLEVEKFEMYVVSCMAGLGHFEN